MLTPVEQFKANNPDIGSWPQDDHRTSFVKDTKKFTMPSGWKTLRYVKEQVAYYNSTSRFNVVPAGRRAGKSEIAVRRAVLKALQCRFDDGRVILAAPTHSQAKRIFWAKLKRLVPREFVISTSESELAINLINGCVINVIGLDVPERVEGTPITHIDMDEYGNMRPNVWSEHVRPALSDHQGTADFTGVPEGRNHYYDLFIDAKARRDWSTFHWISAKVLLPEEIEAAKSDLDPLTYQQEYEGSFVNFQGRVYYVFGDANVTACKYDPEVELIFAFDFNKSPGVAAVLQEQNGVTKAIDEVHIPQHSNTALVCDELIRKWQHHSKIVRLYGDATGGQGGSAKVAGSDWDIIEFKLRKVFLTRMEVPNANPPIIARINATNSRTKTLNGGIRFHVDPRCVNIIKDMEGVRILVGTNTIDKKSDPKLTHISDALGYYFHRRFPTVKNTLTVKQI